MGKLLADTFCWKKQSTEVSWKFNKIQHLAVLSRRRANTGGENRNGMTFLWLE